MTVQLKNLVKQITTNAELLAASSEELTANYEQSAQASNQVASFITEMALKWKRPMKLPFEHFLF